MLMETRYGGFNISTGKKALAARQWPTDFGLSGAAVSNDRSKVNFTTFGPVTSYAERVEPFIRSSSRFLVGRLKQALGNETKNIPTDDFDISTARQRSHLRTRRWTRLEVDNHCISRTAPHHVIHLPHGSVTLCLAAMLMSVLVTN